MFAYFNKFSNPFAEVKFCHNGSVIVENREYALDSGFRRMLLTQPPAKKVRLYYGPIVYGRVHGPTESDLTCDKGVRYEDMIEMCLKSLIASGYAVGTL